MSEFVGVTAAGGAGDSDEWTDGGLVEESGAVEGFEEWGAMALPTKAAKSNGSKSHMSATGKAGTSSQELGLFEADTDTASAADHNEGAAAGDNWSWGAAWSAFTTAVQQDVKEIAGTVKKSVSTLRDEFQPDDKPAQLPGEIPEQDESESSDKELDAGLGAIDQQVDQIASAAGKALGSLWTGIGGAITSTAQAASSVAGQLEQAALQATSTNGRRSSPWTGRNFGGRSQGPWVLPRDGTQEDEWQVLDLLGSPATSVAASFDQLFKLYRGHRFSEELEALGNEAARSCNRVRTQLPEMQRSELDSIVAQTASLVDLGATIAPTQDAHSAARALVHDIPSSSQHLENGQLPLAHRGGPREGLSSMCAASVDRAVHMRDTLSTESPQKAWEGLCRVRAEGLKLLAEFTALSIQHMAFLAMCLEGGDAEAAGLLFLPDGSNKGAVVRGVLLQLLSDTDAIFEAFYTALEQATDDEEFAAMLLDQPADDGSDAAADELGIVQQHSSLTEISGGSTRDASLQPNMALVVGELKGGLLVGVKAAVDRIMQGSRNLVYPICAPAAVRLDAETGLSPIPDIGQQPYEHVANPEPSPAHDADVGSGPMFRQRTTSLSNPLFETVGAVPSHMSSRDPMSAAVEREEEESPVGADGSQQPSVAASVEPVSASIAEAASPLTGIVQRNEDVVASPAVPEEEDSLTRVQPPRLGPEAPAASAQETSEQNTAQVSEPEVADAAEAAEPASSAVVDTVTEHAAEAAAAPEKDDVAAEPATEPRVEEEEVAAAPTDVVEEPASEEPASTSASTAIEEPATAAISEPTASEEPVSASEPTAGATEEPASIREPLTTSEPAAAVPEELTTASISEDTAGFAHSDSERVAGGVTSGEDPAVAVTEAEEPATEDAAAEEDPAVAPLEETTAEGAKPAEAAGGVGALARLFEQS